MDSDKKEGRKLFFTAFALSLVLLSLAMVSTVLAVQPSLPGRENEDTYIYQPPASDTLTLIVAALKDNKPHDFLLIRYNPQYGQIPLVLLPPDTLIPGSTHTLSQAYEENGTSGLKQAVSDTFSIVVDRYAILTGGPFLRVAAKTGSVSCTLPYEISFSRDGYPVRFAAGKQQLDGQALLDLFDAPTLCSDPVEKSSLLGGIVADAINQNIGAGSDKRASGLFKLAVNALRTDVTSTDFELRRQSAAFLADMEGRRLAGNLPVEGVSVPEGYQLSGDFAELVRKYFQPSA